MKVPLRWLSDLVDTGLPVKELTHRLTMAGLEAEKIDEIGSDWANVFVGLVERVERHPNADRLVLATVVAGDHHLTVVTGAPNIAAGQKVALAIAGARLIDGHSDTFRYQTLKPGMIRGVRSEGMVCSEKELGLSDEHEGIMVLDDDAPVGAPLAAWLGDTVVEFEITPNLVHAFSILGIAREAAALTASPLRLPPITDLPAAPPGDDTLVRVDAPDLCARYVAVAIEGLSVEPSPGWLTRRLTAAGLRPINNIVDVTNYVMLEWGQPLHAFDRAPLHDGRIVVRRAAPGETIETLDHQQRDLTPDMLIIADAVRPVGIAGVMGGVDSEVDAGTTTIVLESANFEMKSVRHTARALKLRTDASARFERGLDPNLAGDAAARATQLILDLCPGSRVTAVRDVYPRPRTPWTVEMPFAEIERLLGVRYEPDAVLDVLSRLGFVPTLDDPSAPDATLRVEVPTYRQDVNLPADVVEEVARLIGYDTLPETLPSGGSVPIQRDPMYRLQRAARALLVAACGTEAITYVTTSEPLLRHLDAEGTDAGFLHRVPFRKLVRVRNPLQSDRSLLRPTLLPSILEVAVANLKHETGVRLFEIARLYLPTGRDELPHEADVIGLVLAGRRDPLSRFTTDVEMDYFDLKGIVEALLHGLGVREARFEPSSHPALHPGRAAAICAGSDTLGLLGELRPDVADAYGIETRRVGVAEIDLEALLPRIGTDATVHVPRFLPVEQDFAVVVPETTPAADIEQALLAGAGPLATGIALFDVYRGPQIGADRKSLAFRVTFTAPDRALTDAELAKVRDRIAKALRQRVDGTLRA